MGRKKKGVSSLKKVSQRSKEIRSGGGVVKEKKTAETTFLKETTQ